MGHDFKKKDSGIVIPGLRAGTCCAVLRGYLLIVCKQVRLSLFYFSDGIGGSVV